MLFELLRLAVLCTFTLSELLKAGPDILKVFAEPVRKRTNQIDTAAPLVHNLAKLLTVT